MVGIQGVQFNKLVVLRARVIPSNCSDRFNLFALVLIRVFVSVLNSKPLNTLVQMVVELCHSEIYSLFS